jgi:hypothetical protein
MVKPVSLPIALLIGCHLSCHWEVEQDKLTRSSLGAVEERLCEAVRVEGDQMLWEI